MSIEVLDSGIESGHIESDESLAHMFDEHLDARRRVEDKIEEMRLARETQEYDFDF